MAEQPRLRLNDGNDFLQFGLGVWQVPNAEAAGVVTTAIEAGYRAIDTAAGYNNEEGVGAAIAAAAVPRRELTITTKLRNEDQGYDQTLRAFDASMKRLRLEQLDLYLIHWPLPQRGAYLDTWRAFIKLRDEGRIRSIGVSNFTPVHLTRLIEETGITPVVNQIELHPRFQQKKQRAFHASKGIATQCWSPLGQGTILTDPTIGELAKKYGKTPAQVIIRWHLDNGLIVIPKSVTPARIRENIAVFDFELAAEDIDRIDALDNASGRIGPDPDRFG